mgnify:CR=1 FL=1
MPKTVRTPIYRLPKVVDGKVQKNGVKKKQKPLGRPPYQPTDEDHQKVSMMAAFGLTRKDIYGILKMSAATFREHHEEDYTLGLAKAVMTVASRVYKTAISEKPTAFAAQQFFLKARGGWKENQNIQLTGKNGGPLEIEHKNIIDTRNMDPEARDMLIAALEQIIESEQDHDAIDDIGSTQH